LAERNFFPELCSSPILAVNGSGMNPEDIPEYLGGSFRTNNSITCRHVENFPKKKKKNRRKRICHKNSASFELFNNIIFSDMESVQIN
jgi:hypothetical protein